MVATIMKTAILVLGLAVMVTCQEEAGAALNVTGEEVSTRPPLTGIPQIDYIWDPNLPRELNGFNLSYYPFYSRVPAPEKMDFKCDGLHDGFYASVPHHCQVYHQCLFGTRYDFLCANFTAFDQKNFICHFANEVDCENSPKFFDKNEALYKWATTTTELPLIPRSRPFAGQQEGNRNRRPNGARRRRPMRPVYYDDYYDYDYQEEDDVPGNEDDGQASPSPASDGKTESENPDGETADVPARPAKGNRPRPGHGGNRFFNPANRPPPRIKPRVPNAEDSAGKKGKTGKSATTTTVQPEEEEDYDEGEEVSTAAPTPAPTKRPKSKRPKTTTTTAAPEEEEEVEEEEEEPVTTPRPRKAKVVASSRKVTRSTTTPQATTTSTTKATTTTTEAAEEEEEEEPAPVEALPKDRASLFNRRAPGTSLLKRRIVAPTTKVPGENVEEEDEDAEEPPAPSSTTLTTTTTTTTTTRTPTKRITRARANGRTQAPVAPVEPVVPVVVEPVVPEQPAVPARATVVRTPIARTRIQVDTPVEKEEAPEPIRPSPAGRSRLQIISRRGQDAAPAGIELPKARQVPQVEAEVNEEEEDISEVAVDFGSRRERGLEAEPVKLAEPDFDEDLSESQWSIIQLFSRVFPQRA